MYNIYTLSCEFLYSLVSFHKSWHMIYHAMHIWGHSCLFIAQMVTVWFPVIICVCYKKILLTYCTSIHIIIILVWLIR